MAKTSQRFDPDTYLSTAGPGRTAVRVAAKQTFSSQGDPADCLLLWQKRDTALLAYFINQIQDSAEKERAWQRYHNIVDFVESKRCRHRQICVHFGETPKWTSCESCDVCSGVPEWLIEPTTVRSGAATT